MKDKLITQVQTSMSPLLDAVQLEELGRVLTNALHNVEIMKKKTSGIPDAEENGRLLEALCAAAVTGELCTGGIDPEIRRKGLEKLHRFHLELAAVKAQAKKETDLAKSVELNLTAKTIEQQIEQTIRSLS